jgi:heme exporter protein D
MHSYVYAKAALATTLILSVMLWLGGAETSLCLLLLAMSGVSALAALLTYNSHSQARQTREAKASENFMNHVKDPLSVFERVLFLPSY